MFRLAIQGMAPFIVCSIFCFHSSHSFTNIDIYFAIKDAASRGGKPNVFPPAILSFPVKNREQLH